MPEPAPTSGLALGNQSTPGLHPQLEAERGRVSGDSTQEGFSCDKCPGTYVYNMAYIPLQGKVREKFWYWQKEGLELEEAREIPTPRKPTHFIDEEAEIGQGESKWFV